MVLIGPGDRLRFPVRDGAQQQGHGGLSERLDPVERTVTKQRQRHPRQERVLARAGGCGHRALGAGAVVVVVVAAEYVGIEPRPFGVIGRAATARIEGVAGGAQADEGSATFEESLQVVHLIGRESRNQDISGSIITETMHERKKVMFMNADAVVALPGGPGTLDELFEVLTWRQLGLHSKPILLLNTLNYWDPLVGLIDTVIARGFADASFAGFLTTCQTPGEVIGALRERLCWRSSSTQ